MEQGRFAEAEELLGQALEVMLGDKNIEAHCARTRGILRRRTGNLQEAEELGRHSLRLWEAQEFRNELEIAFVERDLGEIRFEQGNLEKSFEFLSKAAQRIEEHVSRDHPKLGAVYSRIAQVEAARGMTGQALDLAARAVGMMSVELTEADSDLTACRALVATLERS
jgi:tetratricopeptide (TPR) repeat protein